MNFKNNVVPPTKKPLFPWYGQEYMMQTKKRSVSLLTLFLIIIGTFLLAFLLFKNFDRIENLFVSSEEISTGLQIGQEVILSGEIKDDGDLILYTHTLTLADATMYGLKSRTLDLSMYSGRIDIQGVVEKEYNDMFIIEVNLVSWALAATWMTGDVLWIWWGMYISQAGIYLPEEFSQSYSLLNQGENGTLKIQNLVTNQIVLVSYFICKTSDPNKNCTQLQKNIWSSAEKIVTTLRGDKLYKLEGVTSRFFTNGNNYGYFINDVPEQEVVDLANAIILPTESYIQDNLLEQMQTLCSDGSTSLMQVDSYDVSMGLNGLVAVLQGPTVDGSASCKIFIDPSQDAGGTKISYVSNTTDAVDEPVVTDTSASSLANLDTSVKQFPINLEKALTFTSSRWYSIVFPSSNIAYESVNVDETLDLPGVRCSVRMDVIKYSDKDMLHDMPAVSIYTCSIKGILNNLGNSIIQKESENWTKFLIQIVDPAWMDFATNIQIN